VVGAYARCSMNLGRNMPTATAPDARHAGYLPHWKLKTTGVIMPEERCRGPRRSFRVCSRGSRWRAELLSRRLSWVLIPTWQCCFRALAPSFSLWLLRDACRANWDRASPSLPSSLPQAAIPGTGQTRPRAAQARRHRPSPGAARRCIAHSARMLSAAVAIR